MKKRIILTEELNENHPYWDCLSDYDTRYVISMIKEGENLWTPLINPNMYQKALSEFTRFGYLDKFPTKYIYQWMGILMKNTAILRTATEICGHTPYCPIDELVDELFYNSDTEDAYENFEKYKEEIGEDDDYFAITQYLDDNGYLDALTLPDGTDAISDYGLEPLEKLIASYDRNMSPEETLVLINKILDVTHQRGDLASMFIDGGSQALTKISYNESRKNKTLIINETQYKKLLIL